ncbi:MAG TPA: cytochrome C oxidase subunit IV family protein, partial [Candidatus Limnocylindrales bacterium]|nr:cytochrome C oxidase subunit IV family protein [Candidatus Limnocylindrales bacterium]
MADAASVQPAATDAATAVMPAAQTALHNDAHPAQETLFGRPIPFAAYTAIYAILAVTSLVEVLLAELIPFDSWIRIPLLGGLSVMKAVLVMAYYMHLKDDSK